MLELLSILWNCAFVVLSDTFISSDLSVLFFLILFCLVVLYLSNVIRYLRKF